jgi:hypothetical protein
LRGALTMAEEGAASGSFILPGAGRFDQHGFTGSAALAVEATQQSHPRGGVAG